ncbi:Uncharacterized protein PCOAH_00044970 [Plasmodium coatneyi]|uniref:Uncharacterized protein n=1 Tax=Plasmodium coatneyi TaxID=208452 RepID=A0A1B1E5L4_9APIC|nr:Uncharacterized protein PCOAH_00044970 [Plasmodium coatneyi]ANQ10230.1 Uncharacterized protein PCOAH_00044970 [Plasmodium coatneyi]
MNKAQFLFLLSVISLLWKGADIKCSAPTGAAPKGPSFAQTKAQSAEKNMPDLFSLFSAKPKSAQPMFNFFLEENRNLWLHRTKNNEANRNTRRRFSDFQELRQNDLSRFHELMSIQNEQMNMLKNAILSMEEV